MTAPPPPPAPGDQGAPPRARRRTWVVVLVAVMAAILAVAGAGTALFISSTLPPYSSARDFVEDIVDGQVQSAVDSLCRSAMQDPEAAIASVVRNFGGGRSVSVNPLTVDREGDRATVEYGVRPRDGSADRVFALPMRKERGDWKPCPGAGR